MLIKLVVFFAVGVLVPTCHSFHTFGVNKVDYDDYVGESDIEENIKDLPNASTERDLIDIRPEEAFDNEIPDADGTFTQEESTMENTDTNIRDVDLEPETDDKKKDTEWDESKSEEDDEITGIKSTTESTVIEEVTSVDGPLFFFKFHFSNNDLDSVDNKSDEEDSVFHVKFSVNDDDLENIDEDSEEESHSVVTSTDSSVDDSLFVKIPEFPEFPVSDNDLETVEITNDNNDDFHLYHFKISFNNDDELVDNSDKVDNEKEEESNLGFLGTSFDDNIDVEDEVQPDITIITPADAEADIEEYFRYQKYLATLDSIQKLQSEVEAYLKEITVTEKAPVHMYNYWNQNRKYYPYDLNDYEADLFKEKSGYSDNFGYFGRVLEPTSNTQVQSNPFEDRHWHVSPVYRPYAMRFRK